ncbi:hypothetical protein DYP60_01530 [Sphaerochaeta halotolerans]|uniref:O-antigen ligase domain-containing protein n=1 Tax=Sphaerochaeta halotolerans TaxID=2293840 RepID=A0A372MKG3_9SPIR|nr:hypothetical protein [Sphaerochaeta halotolerans]RFU96275.1 hypothetical protein DYP60_01530 [Sphaerochaeta halotolerans]
MNANDILNLKKETSERIAVPFSLMFILSLYLVLHIYNLFFSFGFEKFFYASLTIVILGHTLLTLRNKLTWQDFVVGVILFYALAYFRFGSYRGNASTFLNMPYLLVGLSLGLLFRYATFPRFFFIGISIIVLFPFFYIFYVLKVESTLQAFNLNRNTFPRILLFTVSLHVLESSILGKKYICIFPSIATVWISFLSQSRTGFLASIVLLSLLLIYNTVQWYIRMRVSEYWEARRQWVYLIFIIVLALLGIIFSQLFNDSRFASEGLSSNGRLEIYRYFFSELNLRNFFLGFHPSKNANLHNSYFALISMYGIIGVFFIILIFGALYRLTKKSFLQFGLLLIWCLYSIPETVAPFKEGTFLLMPLLMLAYPPKRLDKRIFPLRNRKRTS